MTDNNDTKVADVKLDPVAAPNAEAASPIKELTEEDANFGHALREIYQQTIEEQIPDEMLDLLKRLG